MTKVEGQGDGSVVPLEGALLPAIWTFDMVQDRLIEAMIMLWRMPDRERGWQRVRSLWPDIWRHNHFGDYADTDPDAVPRVPPATREEIGEMEEALGWMRFVPDRDRKLVGLAIGRLARGERAVAWRDLLAPMGVKRGADGLRMRYGRAINRICVALSGGNPLASVSTPEICDL
ncbi:hypothetical protein DFR49_3373 [Hephaestia caeni]|uniref:DUF6362 domain-containing protein n=1 Tax=Hephaestia caeni TaxID=645617 RepID=A0A397NM91_9SPHN|nr:DUF6362 family protein [Hephaestia caeni]RIA37488.1 hypothetical protein DFR49_3373 [Hephaestia caeni]